MKKGKTIETPLPEEVIQHIQSFLTGKEAAQSAILSKSWYAAWLTRPAIDLYDGDFGYSQPKLEQFWKKTIQRYQYLNLNIQSFRLRCSGYDRSRNRFNINAWMEELSRTKCGGGLIMNLSELHKLRSLFLNGVSVDTHFFTDFTSRFPCLKDLAILRCHGYTRIQIASTSLETITFEPVNESQEDATFEVPNIRKFTHSSFDLPSQISVKGASREWELDLSLVCNRLHKSWFLNLKNLVSKFMLSRISLYIRLRLPWTFEHDEVGIEVVSNPLVVENLRIEADPAFCCALLVHLFGICRPKFITQDRLALKHMYRYTLFDFLYDMLMEQVITPNCGIPDQKFFGQFNLKKVNMEVCEMFDDKERRPLVLKKPLDVTKAPENNQKVRFELIWD